MWRVYSGNFSPCSSNHATNKQSRLVKSLGWMFGQSFKHLKPNEIIFFGGGGLLHEMLENSPIWKRILSFLSKGQFLLPHWLTSTTQWHSIGDHSSKLRCEQATAPKPLGNWFFNKASKPNSINQHHCQPTSLAPKKQPGQPNLPRYHLQKLPRCFRLAGIQFKGCQVGTHFFRVELLTKVHPCDQFSVLQTEIQILWDQQSSFQVKKPGIKKQSNEYTFPSW